MKVDWLLLYYSNLRKENGYFHAIPDGTPEIRFLKSQSLKAPQKKREKKVIEITSSPLQ
jgi:hypothetical protein